MLSERTRVLVWDRDDGACQKCNGPGQEIHHLTPKSMGGRHGEMKERINDMTNLILICRACHYRIHHGGK